MNEALKVHHRDCNNTWTGICTCDRISKEQRPWVNPFQVDVQTFHERTGGRGTIYSQEGRELRAKLIMEEAVETVAALGFSAYGDIMTTDGEGRYVAQFSKAHKAFNLLEYIDGLADLVYVTVGGAINAGINLQRHFDEVHAANMRKLSGPKRADGKQLKPEGWEGPNHLRVLKGYYSPWLEHTLITQTDVDLSADSAQSENAMPTSENTI